MQRKLFFIYGVLCHALFLGVYAWMAVFVGNLGFGLIPTIDGPREGSLAMAVGIDAVLIAIFGVQHSVMARPGFKSWWTKFIPQPIERSTYVLASNLLMILLMWQWRPIGGIVWDVTNPAGRWALHGLFAFGWLMVPAVSLLINHFDLFGTRQVWLHLRGQPYTSLPFRTPMAYSIVRHPLYVGWMIAFWATPTMTAAHLLFAVLMTAYIFIAIPFEDRDLVSYFGEKYESYRARVGGLIPKIHATLDTSILRDSTWWSWVIVIALLIAHFATGNPGPIVAAIVLCLGLTCLDIVMRRSDIRTMAVQIRIGYALLLIVGLLPGMGWMHVVQLVGATARVITGYCLLHRELLMMPWNSNQPLTLTSVWRILTSRPGAGGLLYFGGHTETISCGTTPMLART